MRSRIPFYETLVLENPTSDSSLTALANVLYSWMKIDLSSITSASSSMPKSALLLDHVWLLLDDMASKALVGSMAPSAPPKESKLLELAIPLGLRSCSGELDRCEIPYVCDVGRPWFGLEDAIASSTNNNRALKMSPNQIHQSRRVECRFLWSICLG